VSTQHTYGAGTRRPYSTPKVTKLGTLHELTLQPPNKDLGGDDGFTFQGMAIHFTSP
jgi:hypothetical protein